jgi:hypothetical protein
MKHLGLITALMMLALPGGAVAAGRSGTAGSAGATPHRGAVSFYARVLRASPAAVVLRRLSDGADVHFSADQVTRAPGAVSDGKGGQALLAHLAEGPRSLAGAVEMLQPGVIVVVAQTAGAGGRVNVAIRLPDASAPAVARAQRAGGLVGDVSQTGFVLDTPGGAKLSLQFGAHRSPSLQVCETVHVVYRQSAGTLIVERVRRTGRSHAGSCAAVPATRRLVGLITQITSGGLTLGRGRRAQTFTLASPGPAAGFQAGDLVTVTYTGGQASDVEYVERTAGGSVTAVAGGSLTIASGRRNRSQTFVADPAQAMFAGLAVGDRVLVTYHQTGGGLVADVAAVRSSPRRSQAAALS